MSVAGKLGNGALELGVNLGVELPAIKSLEANHPRDVQRVLLEILVMWNNGLEETSESAVMELLCIAVSNMHRNDVVLFIQNGELVYDISCLTVFVLFDSNCTVIHVIDFHVIMVFTDAHCKTSRYSRDFLTICTLAFQRHDIRDKVTH